MTSDRLVRTVLSGVLGARGKRTRNAARYLTGAPGRVFSNPALLLGAAGVAWGVVETLQRSRSAAGEVPPPLPVAPVPAADSPVDSEALRVVRLAISAAGADGRLTEPERAAIVRQASAAGLADLVERELQDPRPLAEIVGGIARPEDAATLYVMAYTILRADEQVSGAERIYLARLAQLLKLGADTVAALERDTGERIDALGDQGQPGG